MQVQNPLQGRVWKMLVVNTLTCGLDACMAVETVYIPPLLLEAGMEKRYMSMVLAMSTLLSFIIVPMIGLLIDSWQGQAGHHKTFILILSLGVLLGLLIIPQARHLAVLMCSPHPHWLEAALIAGAVCLTNMCTQACQTVLTALLSDLFPTAKESCRAFSIKSLMINLGGCLGFLPSAVDWSHVPIATYLGGQEVFVFTLLTVFFLGCLLTTAFIPMKSATKGGENKTVTPSPLKSLGCPRSFLSCFLVTLHQCASACMSALPRVYAACKHVPVAMWRLFLADMCSWMTISSITLFFADFMGEALYKGVPSAEPQSQERRNYDEGVRMASVALFLQCVVSMLCSGITECWVALLGNRVVFISGVALLVFATIVLIVSENVIAVTVMVALTGYTDSVVNVIPYTLVRLYHSNGHGSANPGSPQFSISDDDVLSKPLLECGSGSLHHEDHTGELTLLGAEIPVGSVYMDAGDGSDAESTPVSERGVCFDMAILHNAYLLSEIVPPMCLGLIVQLVGSVRAYMGFACCFSLLAFFFSTKVVYEVQH